VEIMNVKRNKPTPEEREGSKPKSRAAASLGRKAAKKEELEVDWLEGGQGRINQQEVDAQTDRVFQSVLSRFGWMRDPQGHIEHVGAERR
jgi:hypothetical protein